MMNDGWRNHKAFFHKNIYHFFSSKAVESSVGWERQMEEGDQLMELDTCILTFIVFLPALCHTHCFPKHFWRSSWLTESQLAARLKLTITLWVPVYLLFHNANAFYSSTHLLITPSHRSLLVYTGAFWNHFFLHGWNIRLCQRSLCSRMKKR